MSISCLAEALHDRLNIPPDQGREIVDALARTIQDRWRAGQSTPIPGVGVIAPKHNDAKLVVSSLPGRPPIKRKIGMRKSAKLVPDKALKFEYADLPYDECRRVQALNGRKPRPSKSYSKSRAVPMDLFNDKELRAR